MSLATLSNIVTAMFCTAVLVQSVRMMRSLQAVKDGALTDVVQALDHATGQARTVLAQLKDTLQTDCASNARKVDEGAALRDELSILIGIGDATAERIMEAADAARRDAPAPPAATSPRRRGTAQRVSDAPPAAGKSAASSAAGRPAAKPARRRSAAKGAAPQSAAAPVVARSAAEPANSQLAAAPAAGRSTAEPAAARAPAAPAGAEAVAA